MCAPPVPDRPPRAPFLRRHRIVTGTHFQRAYRTGSRARGDLLIVVAVPNELDHPRLGLSVGKRIWKSAVRRNRVRRIFREAFRLTREKLPEGVDVILIPAAPQLDPGLAETCEELERLAQKAFHRAPRKPRPQRGERSSETAP